MTGEPPPDSASGSERGRPHWWPNGEPWPPARGRWARGGRWGRRSGWDRGPGWAPGSAAWDGGAPPWAANWGGGPWRGPHGGSFRRRVGCAIFFAVVLAAAIGALGVWAVGTAIGLIPGSDLARAVAIGGVVVGLLLIVTIARGIRTFAAPIEELVEAAGRVEEGDFSARVSVRGPGDVRQLARAFNEMSEQLQETERQRRAYLADVTHELRTPLSVIRGQLEAIVDGVYPADAEHLAPALEQAHTLEGLIEDLRTLTLVETGSLTLRREPVDLAVLVNDAVAALRPRAEGRGVELRVDADASLPAVDADPVRLRSVLTNLLTNAIRHTPASGSVTVEVRATGGVLRLAVRDSGPGFPPDLLPRVFDRFVKAEGSEGSGLGLAIARDLVEAHGGTISAANAPGGGALVSFTLPLKG